MFKDPKRTSPETTATPVEGGVEKPAQDARLWSDPRFPPEQRLESYKALVYEKLDAIRIAFDRAREAGDVATQKEIMNSPETKRWMNEGAWLQAASGEDLCTWIDRQGVQALLGKNFLGADEWKLLGIVVEEAPPLPASITTTLLNSNCPFHPGEKIKDTHLLVLVPKTVNDQPFSALKLDELCATMRGSGDQLIFDEGDWSITWKNQPWAAAPQIESEWVLIPKSDPDPKRVADDKHFRGKTVGEQQQVHDTHYKEYREAKVIEVMTAALLNDLVNGYPRMLDGSNYLRCAEPNASGGRVCVGIFNREGLGILDTKGDFADKSFGWALTRKLYP